MIEVRAIAPLHRSVAVALPVLSLDPAGDLSWYARVAVDRRFSDRVTGFMARFTVAPIS